MVHEQRIIDVGGELDGGLEGDLDEFFKEIGTSVSFHGTDEGQSAHRAVMYAMENPPKFDTPLTSVICHHEYHR